MDSFSKEASGTIRPVLKEITDNAGAQQALKSARKSQNLNVTNDNKLKEECESAEHGREVTSSEQVNSQSPQNIDKTLTGEQVNSNDPKTLPDIVSVPVFVTKEADDSIISSLAKNLNALQLNLEPGSSTDTLTIPTAHCDTASSDDEVYAECQSYADPSTNLTNNINNSIHWDVVVSTVTSSNIENLDYTIDINIDGESSDDLIDSTSTPSLSARTFNINLENENSDTPSSSINFARVCKDVSMVIGSVHHYVGETLAENCVNEPNEQTNTSENTVPKLNETSGNINSSVENQIEMSPIPTFKTPSPGKVCSSSNVENVKNPTNIKKRTPTTKRRVNTPTREVYKECSYNNDDSQNNTYVPNSEGLNSTNKTFNEQFNHIFSTDEGAIDKTILLEDNEDSNRNYEEISSEENCNPGSSLMSRSYTVLKSASAEDILKSLSLEPIDISDSFNKPVPSPEPEDIPAISDKSSPLDENLTAKHTNITCMQPYCESVDEQKRMENSLEPTDNDFQENGFILHPEDFDYLLSKGDGNIQIDDRNSLLLRFDPLLGHSVPANQQQNNKNLPGLKLSSSYTGRLTPAVEEDDDSYEVANKSLQRGRSAESPCLNIQFPVKVEQRERLSRKSLSPQTNNRNKNTIQVNTEPISPQKIRILPGKIEKDGKMSADVIQDMNIENDVKSGDDLNTKSSEKADYKMDDLEKKIKSEVQIEDIEKKLKEAEQKEEALLKRITEKDKTIAKMSGVIEAYEKAIAELIAEKEQIIQNYEKQMAEIKAERDLNYQHLTSLESTFSDLHVKYERSKQLTAKLKANEDELKAEKKQHLENLRLQEQRYEKMKNHAMQQLEIANNKLESLTKNHAMEVTRLKALLKKEEISRLSINEQLIQKSRENEELMKICDELINGQGASS